jgi:rRNA maturation endonuclease Nob1
MSHIYVVDAGVLFSTWMQRYPESLFFTTPHIREEVQNRPSKFRTDILSILEKLREELPLRDSIEEVRKTASDIGDINSLSENDIELIALAHSKSKRGASVDLVSSDMAILNTARRMGIRTIDPSGKFKIDIEWVFVCPGCGHKSKKQVDGLECPVCGTTMRRKVLKKHGMK